MAKPTLWKDEYTLLCEKCGYVLEGLDTATPCPECGKPISESLPERRIGTPWQQKPGVKSLMQTWWMTLRHPNRLFDNTIIQRERASSLIWIGLLAASISIIAPIILLTIALSVKFELIANNLVAPIIYLGLTLLYWCCAGTYSVIAIHRIRYFAYIRNHRVSSTSACVIAAHSSVGLALAPFSICIALFLGVVVVTFDIDESIPIGSLLVLTMRVLAWLAIPLAIVVFEILLSIGTRRFRYRNLLPTDHK